MNYVCILLSCCSIFCCIMAVFVNAGILPAMNVEDLTILVLFVIALLLVYMAVNTTGEDKDETENQD